MTNETNNFSEPERILLAGNGINKAQEISWGKMLNYIQNKCILNKELRINALDTKVSPSFIFEYICHNTDGGENEVRKNIKDYVADKSNFIKKIWKIYNTVLTTNFDDNLNISKKKELENKQVLKLRFEFDKDSEKKKIFYIHGYYDKPETICLGFKQYVNNLKLIENYAVQYYPLKKEFWENHIQNAWIDFFFRDNITIDILGLRLASDEIDIWWVLNYRKELLKLGKIKNNTINYFDLSAESFKDNEAKKKELKDKKALMESMEIYVCEISETTDYDSDYYSLCLKKINSNGKSAH